MKKQKRTLKDLNIDKSWTLFLDRDGVINKKIENDYVRSWKQFEFLPGVLDALKTLSSIFGRIIIVTNQRGIGRGLMTREDLENIHKTMLDIFKKNRIKVDAIYYCPHNYENEKCHCRKPDIGMAIEAKKDFPDIDFFKSVMVGDSISDMEFGNRLNMYTVFIGKGKPILADVKFNSLPEFTEYLVKNLPF